MAMSSLQMKLLLVITYIVSIAMVESAEPISGYPLLIYSPDQVPQQKLLFQTWHDCHDAFVQTGNCFVDILKAIWGLGGGVPGGGGDGGQPASGGSPPADPPKADGGGKVEILDDAPGGGGGLPGIGGGIPGIGGGIPGIGGGIPGIGITPVCCDALTGLEKSCPGLQLNPLYAPLLAKLCPAH